MFIYHIVLEEVDFDNFVLEIVRASISAQYIPKIGNVLGLPLHKSLSLINLNVNHK